VGGSKRDPVQHGIMDIFQPMANPLRDLTW